MVGAQEPKLNHPWVYHSSLLTCIILTYCSVEDFYLRPVLMGWEKWPFSPWRHCEEGTNSRRWSVRIATYITQHDMNGKTEIWSQSWSTLSRWDQSMGDEKGCCCCFFSKGITSFLRILRRQQGGGVTCDLTIQTHLQLKLDFVQLDYLGKKNWGSL